MSAYVENVCWSVEERAWKQDLPYLSDDVIALLATPVIVTASAWAGSDPPAGKHRRGVPRAAVGTA